MSEADKAIAADEASAPSRPNIFDHIVAPPASDAEAPQPVSAWRLFPALWCVLLLLVAFPEVHGLWTRIGLSAGSAAALAVLVYSVRGWWLLNYLPLVLMIGFLTFWLWAR